MEALRNSVFKINNKQNLVASLFNEDQPQKDAYQAAVQNAKDFLINQT